MNQCIVHYQHCNIGRLYTLMPSAVICSAQDLFPASEAIPYLERQFLVRFIGHSISRCHRHQRVQQLFVDCTPVCSSLPGSFIRSAGWQWLLLLLATHTDNEAVLRCYVIKKKFKFLMQLHSLGLQLCSKISQNIFNNFRHYLPTSKTAYLI